MACSILRRQLSDTVSRLAEVVVEVNVTAVDWLANFSDWEFSTKLQESYKVVKSASKIRIRRFFENLTTSQLVDLRRKILQQFYDCLAMFCNLGPWSTYHKYYVSVN